MKKQTTVKVLVLSMMCQWILQVAAGKFAIREKNPFQQEPNIEMKARRGYGAPAAGDVCSCYTYWQVYFMRKSGREHLNKYLGLSRLMFLTQESRTLCGVRVKKNRAK